MKTIPIIASFFLLTLQLPLFTIPFSHQLIYEALLKGEKSKLFNTLDNMKKREKDKTFLKECKQSGFFVNEEVNLQNFMNGEDNEYKTIIDILTQPINRHVIIKWQLNYYKDLRQALTLDPKIIANANINQKEIISFLISKEILKNNKIVL